MSKHETPMTRWYGQQVGGTLIEEFCAVRPSKIGRLGMYLMGPSAREFVQGGSITKVVLIDGDGLLELMMRHKIGVRVERTVELLDLDQNYFEEV